MTPPAGVFQRAIALLQAGDPAAATVLPELERFVEYGPGWLALGEFLSGAGQQKAALAAFQRAANAPPPNQAAWRALGQCCGRLGDRPGALVALARAVEIDPGYADGWYSLGLAHQDGENPEPARRCYAAALRIRPDFHEAAFNLAVALQETGALPAAMDAYAAALKLNPSSFGRIAQALTSARRGALWLEPQALRADLVARGLIARRGNASGNDPGC